MDQFFLLVDLVAQAAHQHIDDIRLRIEAC